MAHVHRRLAAGGGAVAQLVHVGRVVEQGEAGFHVLPQVRVVALALGEHAGVFQVAHTHVVGGQRHPGAVRFLDAVRHPVVQLTQVGGAGTDALGRVGAVGDAHFPGGAVGQHHQALDPGGGDRLGVPQGFLIGHRRQQAPVEAGVHGRFLELGGVAGQAVVHMADKAARRVQVELVHMAVETVRQPGGGAVRLGLGQKALRRQIEAAVVVGAERPRQALIHAQGEAGRQVRKQRAVDRIGVGVDQGVVAVALLDQGQQLLGGGVLHLLEAQFRVVQLRRHQHVRVAAAGAHQHLLADQVGDLGGALVTQAVHHQGVHVLVGGAVAQRLVAVVAGQQGGCGQIGLTAAHRVLKVGGAVHLQQAQFHAQALGKAARQLVFHAGEAVGVTVDGGQ